MSRTAPPPQAAAAAGGGGNPSSSNRHTIIHSRGVLQHLRGIFDGLSGGSDALSPAGLARWMERMQLSGGEEFYNDGGGGGGGYGGGSYGADGGGGGIGLQKSNLGLGFQEFVSYVASSAGTFDALGPLPDQDRALAAWPLSNYFISSSHNTYLTGHQLYGKSSTEGYQNVLLRGCRCIEIDVWDGEPKSQSSTSSGMGSPGKEWKFNPLSERDGSEQAQSGGGAGDNFKPVRRGEPRVLHGYTLTKEVSFREVCVAIRESAFVTSDLPVIVSLEVHASPEQQEIMVSTMREVWAGVLLDDSETDVEPEKLPSPGDLRNKILVKVKAASPKRTPEEERVAVASQPVERGDTSSPSSSDTDVPKSQKKKKSKIAEALGKLGIYTRSYHFSSLDQPEAYVPNHIFSLSERALMDLHETHSTPLFTHNRDFFMRVYPHGLRVSSSNLDPSVFWRKGVQMVALNWQSCDEGMMLNEGMFAGTGGWVLKPAGYRSDDVGISSSSQRVGQAEAIAHRTLNLTVEVLAGQDIPLPIDDDDPDRFHPYVKCELHVERPEERTGKPIEGRGKSKDGEHKARTKTRKGIHPDFEGQKLVFADITGIVDELSFLRMKVHDDELGKDDLAAWACFRLDRLQQGYRLVHLMDARGVESDGFLLVKITKSLT